MRFRETEKCIKGHITGKQDSRALNVGLGGSPAHAAIEQKFTKYVLNEQTKR